MVEVIESSISITEHGVNERLRKILEKVDYRKIAKCKAENHKKPM